MDSETKYHTRLSHFDNDALVFQSGPAREVIELYARDKIQLEETLSALTKIRLDQLRIDLEIQKARYSTSVVLIRG
jgi:hypothetical protein